MGTVLSIVQSYQEIQQLNKIKIKNNINGNSIIKNKRKSAFKKNENESEREYRKKRRRTIP